MPIASMTGFARAEAVSGDRHWVWELRSVNGRGLDIRCRLPAGYDALEPVVRAATAERCRRGNVSITLSELRDQRSQLRINRETLDQVLALVAELREAAVAPPRLDGLLALPGVLERLEGDEEPAQHMALLTQGLGEALDGLKAMRLVEGERLAGMVLAHLDAIARLTEAAAASAASQPESIARRLREQVSELIGQLPPPAPERLAQEIALLAARADVREELDRLGAHLAAGNQMIAAGGPIGRKLDFLCQELNREANTLCSKSADVELTRIGLDLKVAIEQLREQVQNIE
jgi:uncharacterized protein (TIGR00255 family)